MRSRHEEHSLIKAANWFFEAEMFSALKHHRKMRNTREIRRRAGETLLWWFRESWGGGGRSPSAGGPGRQLARPPSR